MEYKHCVISQKWEIKMKCVMCNEEAEFIATETNEPLCRNCTIINQDIKHRDYPEKMEKFPPKEIIETSHKSENRK